MLDRGRSDAGHHFPDAPDVSEGAFRQAVMGRGGDLLQIRPRWPVPWRPRKCPRDVPARDPADDARCRWEGFAVESIPGPTTHRGVEQGLIEDADRLERMRGAARGIGGLHRILEVIEEYSSFTRSIRPPLDGSRRLAVPKGADDGPDDGPDDKADDQSNQVASA